MIHKNTRLFLISICLLFSYNTVSAQQGYVVFGNPDNMCQGTGLCNVKNINAAGASETRPTTATFAVIDYGYGPEMYMTVDMYQVYMNQREQYQLFRNGNYRFSNGNTRNRIPLNVFYNLSSSTNYVTIPYGYIAQLYPSAPLPEVPTKSIYREIRLGPYYNPGFTSTGPVIHTTYGYRKHNRYKDDYWYKYDRSYRRYWHPYKD